VQDDWKVNHRLTINLGLRYEYATPIYEANNQLSNFNPATLSMVLATSANRYTVNPNKEDLGPRIGAALSLTHNTVLRGGFGISYSHWNRTGSSYLTLNAPYGIDALQMVYPSTTPNAATGTIGYLNTEASFPANMANPATWDIADAPNVALQYMPVNSPDTQVRSWFYQGSAKWATICWSIWAYVGNSGINEVFFNDINQAAPQTTAGGSASLQSRIFQLPRFWFDYRHPALGYSHYNGLQTKVEQRFTSGLYLLNSFTWSKAIDIAAQSLDGGGNCNNCGNGIPSVQNVYDWQADRAYPHTTSVR